MVANFRVFIKGFEKVNVTFANIAVCLQNTIAIPISTFDRCLTISLLAGTFVVC